MGALPKRKVSGMRRGNRRRYHFIEPLPMGACQTCGTLKPTHRMCPACGTYNGRQVITIKSKASRAE